MVMQLTDDQIKTLKLAQCMISDVYNDVSDGTIERALSAADSCISEAIEELCSQEAMTQIINETV